jgi:UTP-glucose-1-phosphate uridylyltransferase
VKSSVRKVVFPAAGLGTRFLPATKAQPKEMLPLVDKPIIQYVIEEAVASGVVNIIIVTGRARTRSRIISTSTSNYAFFSSAASSICSKKSAKSPT